MLNRRCLFTYRLRLFAYKLRLGGVLLLGLLSLGLGGCVTSPPHNQQDVCKIFKEKRGWYKDARKATKKWGGSIGTNMAIIYHESRFVGRAKPPRRKILWVIPGPRKSSAYGYAQAKTSTWRWYKDKSGNWGADRNDFGDAIDFVAWYNAISRRTLGIQSTNTYALYLAYHEGHTGFKKRTFAKKTWLKNVAGKVSQRAKRYDAQLLQCEKELQSPSWWPF